jgi:hypothetical protein
MKRTRIQFNMKKNDRGWNHIKNSILKIILNCISSN